MGSAARLAFRDLSGGARSDDADDPAQPDAHLSLAGQRCGARADHRHGAPGWRAGDRGDRRQLETSSLFGTDRRKCTSEEHKSELLSLMRISYAVFCLKTKKIIN